MTPDEIKKLINYSIVRSNFQLIAGGLFGICIVEWIHYNPESKRQ